MATPSKKMLMDRLGLDSVKAKILKDQLDAADRSSSARKVDQALETASKMLDAYGVEVINGDWQGGYYADIVALYVNAGDSYDPTLIYVTATDKFVVGSVGDWVERNGDKYGVR